MLVLNSLSSLRRFALVLLFIVCLTAAVLPVPGAEDTKTNQPTAGATPAPATPAPAAPTSPAAPKPSQPRPAARPAAPAAATAPSVNAVTQAAVKAGVLACASRINQVVTFLTANAKSSAFLFLPPKQPDQSIFSVSLGLEGNNTPPRYASASFAPTTNGLASAVYDTVEYVPKPVSEVETKILKNLKRKGTLGKDIVILDGGPVTVFLMPAGSGCIVIKKEVVQ